LAWLVNRGLTGWGYPLELAKIQNIVDSYFNTFPPSADRLTVEHPSREFGLVEVLMHYQTHVARSDAYQVKNSSAWCSLDKV